MSTTFHAANWLADITTDIRAAQRTVTATALSLLPPRALKPDVLTRWWLALADAAQRGVTVNFILPKPTIQHPATLRNEAAAAMLSDIGAAAVIVPTINLLHAKTHLIDCAVGWVGSGNLTAAAAHHNHEAYIRTTDERALAELQGFQQQLIALGLAAR